MHNRMHSDQIERTVRRFAHTEEIFLQNVGGGLGFGIVGGAATGIVVKTILPDGVAGRQGKLQTGDYILKINEEDLYGKGSEYAADLLRSAGQDVYLLVARGEVIEQVPQSRELLQQQHLKQQAARSREAVNKENRDSHRQERNQSGHG